MTRYLEKKLAKRLLQRCIEAQPCKYMQGEWVKQQDSEFAGMVIEDFGDTVRVNWRGILLIWQRSGLRMVPEPEGGILG